MTHKDVDKLLSPGRARARKPEQWVIVTSYDSGDAAYWGQQRDGGIGLTPYRANATRYESENTALHEGYMRKEVGRIGEFTVEQLPQRPNHAGGSGTGGRA
jgi:hypothetical protein